MAVERPAARSGPRPAYDLLLRRGGEERTWLLFVVTTSGLSLTGITGGNSSATTDYNLTTASANVAATITTKPLALKELLSIR